MTIFLNFSNFSWTSEHLNLQEGLVVLLKDHLPPLVWRLAKLNEVINGRDNHVRVVKVNTGSGALLRHIHKLCVLPNQWLYTFIVSVGLLNWLIQEGGSMLGIPVVIRMGQRWHGVCVWYSGLAVSTDHWLPLARTCSVTDYCRVDKETWHVQLLWDHETKESFMNKGNTITAVGCFIHFTIIVPSLHTRPCIHVQCTWD
jgi:hypothetical protein